MQKPWLFPLLILAVYLPALQGQFLWDDFTCFLDDNVMHSANGLWRIWFTRDATDYWPITYSLLWFAYRIFGLATLPYHLLNVLVHTLNVWLIWKLLSKMKFRFAFTAALLFALHPVNVEAVAWIFQIKTTLSTCFALLSLYFWIDFTEQQRKSFYFYSLLFFTFAVLTKTSVVVWPFVLLGFVFYKFRKIDLKNLIQISPFFGVSLFGGLIALSWYHYGELTANEVVRNDTFIDKILLSGHSFWFYLYKDLLPVSLSFIYPRWQVESADFVSYLPILFAFIFLGACGYLAYRKNEKWLWFLGFFVVGVFPVIGFADIYFMRYSYVADHWQYISVMGFSALLASLLPARITYLILVLYAGLTFQRAFVFQSEENLWNDSLTKNPSAWLADLNLGNIRLSQGRGDEALEHFQKALELRPQEASLVNNIGMVYFARGDLKTAKEYYNRSLSIAPSYAQALNNLAAVLLREGDQAGAEEKLKHAVQALPTYFKGFKNLGQLYMIESRFQEAAASYQAALQVRPDDLEARQGLQAAIQALK